MTAARASLKAYLKSKPTDGIATDLVRKFTAIPVSSLSPIDRNLRSLAFAQLASVNAAETALVAARKAFKKRDYENCIAQATTVLDASPNLVEARELRSDCFFGKGDIDDGIGELTCVQLAGGARPSIAVTDHPELLRFSRMAMLNPSSAPLSILVSTLSFFYVTRASLWWTGSCVTARCVVLTASIAPSC